MFIGGYVYEMLSIFDEIQELRKVYTVNIYCVGKVMSAGTIIMLSVPLEHRFAYPNTTFMYHSLSGGAFGRIKDIEESVEEHKRVHELIWGIYKKETSIPEEKLNEIYTHKQDWYLTAEDALGYNIIGQIV